MSIKDLSQSMLDASKAVLELSEMKVAMQIVRGSESKLMPLAKKAGVRFMKPKPGDDEARQHDHLLPPVSQYDNFSNFWVTKPRP